MTGIELFIKPIDDEIILEEWFMLEYNPDIVQYNTKTTESSQICGPQSCELCKKVVSKKELIEKTGRTVTIADPVFHLWIIREHNN